MRWLIMTTSILLRFLSARGDAAIIKYYTRTYPDMRGWTWKNSAVRLTVVAGAVVLVQVFGGVGEVKAGLIAACGFNDAAGINADGIPDSPYQANATALGRGAPEPGWTGTWTGWTGSSNFVAQSDVFLEGDLALRIRNTSRGLGYSTMREYPDQTGVFYLDLYVRPTNLVADGFSVYTGPSSFNAQSVATHIGLGTSGWITALDGNSWENTGYLWVPGAWTRLTQEIDVPNQTYRLWINGEEYLAPDPLNFRHASATFVDDVRFLHTSSAGASPDDVYVDAIRVLDSNPIIPEPSTLILLLVGAAGLLISGTRYSALNVRCGTKHKTDYA